MWHQMRELRHTMFFFETRLAISTTDSKHSMTTGSILAMLVGVFLRGGILVSVLY